MTAAKNPPNWNEPRASRIADFVKKADRLANTNRQKGNIEVNPSTPRPKGRGFAQGSP